MSKLSKRERFEAVLKGEKPDRPPISAWRHFPKFEKNPEELAKALIDFQHKYDWDFIKINPRAVYYHEVWGNKYNYDKYNDVVPTVIEHAINSPKDLEKITEKTGFEKPFEEQLELVRLIKKEFGNEVPIFQTIFTPIGVLLNLCGARSLGRYRKSPREESPLIRLFSEDRQGVHRALTAIAKTLAKYAAATVEAGADGFFYAALGMARDGYMTLEEWEEFAKPYDLMVLNEIKSSHVILHTCGIYSNPERFAHYPIDIIHWAESATGNPKILQASNWIGNKIPMGGVDERLFGTDAEEEILKAAKKSIEANKDIPFVLAPECSVSISTSDSELKAFRQSVEF